MLLLKSEGGTTEG